MLVLVLGQFAYLPRPNCLGVSLLAKGKYRSYTGTEAVITDPHMHMFKVADLRRESGPEDIRCEVILR